VKVEPNQFAKDCAEAFVAVARQYALGEKGVVYVPALTRKSEAAVVELLKLRGYIKAYGDQPMLYYYHILSLSFAMGVILGMLWFNKREAFEDKNILKDILGNPQTSPHDLAFGTLGQFGVTGDVYNDLMKNVWEKFLELHEPYWHLKDPRDYTMSGFFGAFLMGSSVVLAKCEGAAAAKALAVATTPDKALVKKAVAAKTPATKASLPKKATTTTSRKTPAVRKAKKAPESKKN